MVKVIDKDMGWKHIKLNMEELKDRGVKVGLMGNDEEDGVSVIDIGTYNEFGTSRGIPARPFMATTADNYRDATIKFAETVVGNIIDLRYSVDVGLARLGMWYQAKIRETIRNAKQWAVPNNPATVKAKGSTSPLIDTGRMLNSVNYEVQ